MSELEVEKARAGRLARRRRERTVVSKRPRKAQARARRLLYGDGPVGARAWQTTYDPDFHPKSLVEYFRDRFEQMRDPERYATDHKLEYVMKKVRPPTLEGWAASVEVGATTAENWTERYADFKAAHDLCVAMQKSILCESAACGGYNPNVFALWMKNTHGWQDKLEATHRGSVTLNFDKQDEDA